MSRFADLFINQTEFYSTHLPDVLNEEQTLTNCTTLPSNYSANLSSINISSSNLSLCGFERAFNETYEYEYDYNDSIHTIFWDELAPALIVYSVTYLLGVAGNFLLIFTIANYQRLKSTTNIFLGSLATADLLLILICIPVKVRNLFTSLKVGLGISENFLDV